MRLVITNKHAEFGTYLNTFYFDQNWFKWTTIEKYAPPHHSPTTLLIKMRPANLKGIQCEEQCDVPPTIPVPQY